MSRRSWFSTIDTAAPLATASTTRRVSNGVPAGGVPTIRETHRAEVRQPVSPSVLRRSYPTESNAIYRRLRCRRVVDPRTPLFRVESRHRAILVCTHTPQSEGMINICTEKSPFSSKSPTNFLFHNHITPTWFYISKVFLYGGSFFNLLPVESQYVGFR